MACSEEDGGDDDEEDSFHLRCAWAAPSRWICLMRRSKARTVEDDCWSSLAIDEKGREWDDVLLEVQVRGLRRGRSERGEGLAVAMDLAGLASSMC